MEKQNEEDEVFEECYDENNNKEKIKENQNEPEKKEEKEDENKINEEKIEHSDNNNKGEDDKEDKEKKEDKYIPYTIKQAQDKLKKEEEEDSLFPENKRKNSDEKSDSDEEKIQLSEQEKKDIEEKIINERKNAGVLYKNGEYLQALNTYSLLLKDAKRAELNEQCCILNCNKGICFNKLNEYDKALESFKNALKYNKDYSKALCNKMLLLNKKEEYLEAYEDFKRLKTLDYNLWENYRHLEGELSYKAETQKKKMTDEMLGKLKDMGNTILGKFGLSLNNFQMTPNGQGGYSIQYNNNNK